MYINKTSHNGIEPSDWYFSNSCSIPTALYPRTHFMFSSYILLIYFGMNIETIDFDLQNNVLKYSLKNAKRGFWFLKERKEHQEGHTKSSMH